MNSSRRYQLRLSLTSAKALETFAATNGLKPGTALRLLLVKALSANDPNETNVGDSPAALAALTAAEHTVLMVAAVLPEGQRRKSELAPMAAVAAEERLAMFREQLG